MLFAREKGQYHKIAGIDTVFVVKSMLDVTKKMYKQGCQIVTDFIADHLKQKPIEEIAYSQYQFQRIDSIEKTHLPLYTTQTFTDGIYHSFHSFARQQPDKKKLSGTFNKENKLRRIYYVGEHGNREKVKDKSVYAVVYKGKPYITTKYGYDPLEKRKNDFYFTGKASDFETSDILTAEVLFGIIGGLLAQSATSVFEMKIDHLSGGFIRIKEIKETSL